MRTARDRLEEDPITELRRYQDDLSKRYNTPQELSAYYETVPTADEFLAELDNVDKEKTLCNRKCRRKTA